MFLFFFLLSFGRVGLGWEVMRCDAMRCDAMRCDAIVILCFVFLNLACLSIDCWLGKSEVCVNLRRSSNCRYRCRCCNRPPFRAKESDRNRIE